MKKRNSMIIIVLLLLFMSAKNTSGQEIFRILKALHVTDTKLAGYKFPFASFETKQKPTGIKQRLVAHYFLNYFPVWHKAGDSSRLYWPEHEGGDYNAITMLNSSDNTLFEYEDLLYTFIKADSIVRYETSNFVNFDVLDTRTTNTLSVTGLLTADFDEDCIGGNPMTWENDQRNFYEYNSNERLTSMTHENWLNNAWLPGHQFCYFYGPTNKIKEATYSVWDENINAWDTLGKEIRERNASNELTMITGYQEWTNVWEYTSRDSFNYDINHNRTLQLHQIWDGTAWQNDKQTTYEYNTLQQRITDISQEWDVITLSWKNTERLEYTYDPNNKHLSTIRQLWVDDISNWRNEQRTSFTYTNDVVQTLTNAYWNYNTNLWVETDRLQTEYNSNDRLTAYWHEHLTPSGNWESGSGDVKQLFFYEDYDDGLSVNETETSPEIIIYPNPASNELQVDLQSLQSKGITIHNLEGKLVLQNESSKPSDKFNIPVKQLADGMYILKVQTDKGIKTKSFVIRR